MRKDSTTDPRLKSFIEVDATSHFPIQNLPYGVFQRPDGGAARVGVRIGDRILDLKILQERGLLRGTTPHEQVFQHTNLDAFMALGRPAWKEVRRRLSELLRDEKATLRDDSELLETALIPVESVTMRLPASIGDYTDFYSSKEHATNVGTMFRGKENALMPNWTELPVAYHGRSSSIVMSGTDIRRPCGQVLIDGSERPLHSHSHLLDFELEMGFLVGPGSSLGQPVTVDDAPEHIFGLVLVNDWSARDIQKWEYQPLGPFTAKNFATSISPWVVTLEALEPFRCPGPAQEPEPLPYLRCPTDWSFDIDLEVWIEGAKMDSARRVCQSNFRHMYWNVCQQLAHHTVSGCNVQTGDMMASGTISAPDENGFGSMLELTWRGTRPLIFANGEQRKFLADGDMVTMTGYCRGDGYRIGFGQVTGTVLPALI